MKERKLWNFKNGHKGRIGLCAGLMLLFCMLGCAAAMADGALKLPASLTVIEDEAFMGDESITSVEIPEGTTSIGARAFAQCRELVGSELRQEVGTGVNVYTKNWDSPYTTVVSAGNSNSANATVLSADMLGEVLQVEDTVGGWLKLVAPIDGDYYFSVDASDISADNFRIEMYLNGTKVQSCFVGRSDGIQTFVVSNVKAGEALTWWDNDNSGRAYTFLEPFKLMVTYCGTNEGIILPDTLRTIGRAAFIDCSSLSGAVVPERVTSIGEDAFANCADGFAIIGSVGSYAETYADEQGFEFLTNVVPEVTASLTGKVLAEDGTGIEGVAVKLFSEDGTADTVTTNADGVWTYVGAAANRTYQIVCEKEGYVFNPEIVTCTAAWSLTSVQSILGVEIGIPEFGLSAQDYRNEELVLYLTWANMGADYYRIYRRVANEGEYALLAEVEPYGTGSQGASDTTMELGTTYEYLLQAVRVIDGVVYESVLSEPLTIDIKNIYVCETTGFTIGGVYMNLSVYSNGAWTVSSIPDWVKLSQTSGDAGKTTIQVYAKLNNTGADRRDYAYFACGEDQGMARIEQNGFSFDLLNAAASLDEETNGVVLAWTASDDATGYYIYRSTNSESGYVKIAETTNVSYTDVTVSDNTTYYYKVLIYKDEYDGTRTIGYDSGEYVSITTSDSSTAEILPTSVSLNYSQLSVYTDADPFWLTATVSPSDATDQTLTWSSSDTSVATVDQNGLVTIIGAGEATITVRTSNAKKATCELTVSEVDVTPLFSGNFGKSSYALTVGETLQLTGSASVTNGVITRITVKIDGYQPDGADGDNRYATKTFSGATSVNLGSYSAFTLDGTEEPLNTPGTYTMRLWASDDDGHFAQLDTATITVTAAQSAETPTIYATIGNGEDRYYDGDHLGTIYNDQDNMIYLNAFFTNTQRAWFRIEYPEDSGMSGYVQTQSFDVANNEQQWWRTIPKDSPAGIYKIKVDAVNSSVSNDSTAPRTTMTLTIEVKNPDTEDDHSYYIPELGTIYYKPGEFFTDDHTASGNDVWVGGAYQCWGFAKYVQNTIYGGTKMTRITYGIPPRSTSSLKVQTEEIQQQIKDAIASAGPGAHVRVYNADGGDDEGGWGHSFIVTALNDEGLSIIQANGSYGTPSYQYNIISTATWSWDYFFNTTSYGKRGLRFIE